MSARWLVAACVSLHPGFGWTKDLDMPQSREALDYLSPRTMADAHPRWHLADTQAGASWSGFLVWPSMGAGALLDSNPRQKHHGDGTVSGVRLTPQVVAERESGVHATVFYGWADARLYPARPEADQIEGRVGVLHDWAIKRDVILRFQGDLSQARDRIDSRAVVTGRPRGKPFEVRDLTLTASAQKTFDQLFVSLSGDVVRSSFADNRGVRTTEGAPGLSDQTAFDLRARAGYWLGPAVYVFTEPAANWRVLDAIDDRSHGTRLVAGLGTDRMSLIGGDVYAGVQRQVFTNRPGTLTEPVFGARITWWPTPAWTVALALDRRLDQAAIGTPGQPLGTPIDLETETASLRFTPTKSWWAEVGLQHASVSYPGTHRRDQLISFGTTLAYLWRHDLDLTGDVRLTRVESSIALASYERATATLGARYRY